MLIAAPVLFPSVARGRTHDGRKPTALPIRDGAGGAVAAVIGAAGDGRAAPALLTLRILPRQRLGRAGGAAGQIWRFRRGGGVAGGRGRPAMTPLAGFDGEGARGAGFGDFAGRNRGRARGRRR